LKRGCLKSQSKVAFISVKLCAYSVRLCETNNYTEKTQSTTEFLDTLIFILKGYLVF
jgi:hypothetical protein